MIKNVFALLTILSLGIGLLFPQMTKAGVFEFGFRFSYSSSTYDETSFSFTRTWGASAAYHFSGRSGLELSYVDSVDRTKISGNQDTTTHDSVYSLNWIQHLLPKAYAFQPYVKFGVGQLNRSAEGSYANGAVPPRRLDSVTVVFSLGLKVFFLKRFALKSEATTYLTGGSISTWQDNIGITMGLSVFF